MNKELKDILISLILVDVVIVVYAIVHYGKLINWNI